MYELRSYGNRETGEAHYLVDGVEVTKSEYDRCLAEYQLAKTKGGSMNKYLTVPEYNKIVRTMPIQEVQGLFETFQNCQSRTAEETRIMTILEAEVERRISNWEAEQV